MVKFPERKLYPHNCVQPTCRCLECIKVDEYNAAIDACKAINEHTENENKLVALNKLDVLHIWYEFNGGEVPQYIDRVFDKICLELGSSPMQMPSICKCVYESDCHGIEMIKSPSGKEWAVGGTHTKDRFKFCPWCGGSIHNLLTGDKSE